MLAHRKIVLTGAGSGIGLEVLRLLAGEGTNTVFAVDKDITRITGFGENVIPFEIDVSSKEAVDRIFEEADKAMGFIDIFLFSRIYHTLMGMGNFNQEITIIKFTTLNSFQVLQAG